MKVVLLDSHPIYRQALGDLIRKRFKRADIAYATSRAEAQGMVENARPDLVVVDMQTDDIARGGLAALVSSAGGAPTIAIDEGLDPARSKQASRAGAQAYVSKTWSAEMIEAVIALAAAGGCYFSDVARARPEQAVASRADLTTRQAEVLALMLQGHNNREIGRQLGIALPTVKIHMTAVLKALGARNRSEAMALAGGETPAN